MVMEVYQPNEPPAPARFPFFEEGIPDEFKAGNTWVCCDDNKAPMVALVRGWRPAKSTDPNTWRSYGTAVAAFETGRYAGVGRVIEPGGPYVGVDVDGCRNAATGRIDERGLGILRLLDSYSEVSPSGKGVKVWIRARLARSYVKPGLEVYARGRYFTVTGQLLSQFSANVEERQGQVEALVSEFFPRPEPRKAQTRRRTDADPLRLDDVLSTGGIEPLAEISDGTAAVKYAVVCPWAAEHTNGDESGTYVGQYADGALFFKCHHAHCHGRAWRDFRRKVGRMRGAEEVLIDRGAASFKVVIHRG